jgi:hypothetical protein
MNTMAGYRSAIANLEHLGNRAVAAQQAANLQQQAWAAQYGEGARQGPWYLGTLKHPDG